MLRVSGAHGIGKRVQRVDQTLSTGALWAAGLEPLPHGLPRPQVLTYGSRGTGLGRTSAASRRVSATATPAPFVAPVIRMDAMVHPSLAGEGPEPRWAPGQVMT